MFARNDSSALVAVLVMEDRMNGRFSGAGRRNPHPKGKKGAKGKVAVNVTATTAVPKKGRVWAPPIDLSVFASGPDDWGPRRPDPRDRSLPRETRPDESDGREETGSGMGASYERHPAESEDE